MRDDKTFLIEVSLRLSDRQDFFFVRLAGTPIRQDESESLSATSSSDQESADAQLINAHHFILPYIPQRTRIKAFLLATDSPHPHC